MIHVNIYATDGVGAALPFSVRFMLQKWIVDHFEDQNEFVVDPGDHTSHLLSEDVLYRAVPFLDAEYADAWIVPDPIEWRGWDLPHCDYAFVYVEIGVVAFADVAVSRRYGNRLYLSGSINDIAESDEICVYFQRPGDTGIRNLKSDTSDYLYFIGTSGSYDLGANNRYIEFERAGYHWLKIWDVDGNCETPLVERASWLMNIILPRYQYQLIFDLEDPDLGDNLYLLEAEYAKYEAAGSWFVNHEKPDCFTHIQPIDTIEDDTPQSGWLSLGVEFGESPCAPIPYYLCPLPTPQTQYWRGECSCDLFKNTLQPLGIPCSHLIAAMKWYSGEPAWSDYVKCP